MNRIVIIVVAVLLVLVFAGATVTHSVNFNEAAVVTTFGQADEESVLNGSIDGEAGLHFKAPWPFQKVEQTYDTRTQVLDLRPEEIQLADGTSVIVHMTIAWRVTDPLAFFKTLRTVERARGQLESRIAGAREQITAYRFDQLTNRDPAELRLEEAQVAVLQTVQNELTDQGYGLALQDVAITRMVLAEEVTEKVFEQMTANRNAKAQRARSEGVSVAADITSRAQADRDMLLSFAGRQAANIRAQGQLAAARFYEQYQEEPKFAEMLAAYNALPEILMNNTTFIVNSNKFPFNFLFDKPATQGQNEPDSLAGQPAGRAALRAAEDAAAVTD
ncbi:MAG: SPFH domain-containing protein [Phycisphaerae bacterium]